MQPPPTTITHPLRPLLPLTTFNTPFPLRTILLHPHQPLRHPWNWPSPINKRRPSINKWSSMWCHPKRPLPLHLLRRLVSFTIPAIPTKIKNIVYNWNAAVRGGSKLPSATKTRNAKRSVRITTTHQQRYNTNTQHTYTRPS